LSFETAARFFLTYNPALDEARARARRAAAEARIPSVWPNPSVSVDDERASSEQSVAFEQDIPNPATMRSRTASARADASAAAASYQASAADLYLELRLHYLHAAAAEMRLNALDRIAAAIDRAAEIARIRLEEGDLGTFDVQRLGVAAATYADALEELRVESRTEHLAIRSMIAPAPAGPLDDVTFTVSDRLTCEPVALEAEVFVDGALANRAVVRAAESRLEAAEHRLDAERASRWSGFSVTAGVGREGESGSIGPVIGLGTNLPLWNRNGVQIAAALAGVEEAVYALEAQRRTATNEVSAALVRVQSYRERLDGIGAELLAGTDSLLVDALFLYDEGETGLVDLLGAAEAARDARLLRLSLVEGCLESRYELERAAGIRPEEIASFMLHQ
jgi:cobalt-zinc-cadmium efflux system outer membrane protein